MDEDEARHLMAWYGPCATCGAPRKSEVVEDENGTPTYTIVCTRDIDHRA